MIKHSFFVLLVTTIALTTNAQISLPTYADGLSITAKDKSAQVNFGFRMQMLTTVEDPKNGGDINSSMMVRRSRLKSDGFFYSEKFAYKFEIGISNRDIGNGREETQVGNAPRLIYDAVLKYKPNKSWQIWFGQTKLPGNRERVISSGSLQFVDRSLVNREYNIDRDFGIWVVYNSQINNMPLILTTAITNGEGRNMTGDNVGGFSYTGHLDFLPFGKFANKGDFVGGDIEREPKPKLSFGATYNYNQGASRVGGQLGQFITDSLGASYTANLTNICADMMFKYKGWSWMTEYAIRTSNADFEKAGKLSHYFHLGSGFNTQAGYLLKSNYEVSARYTNILAANAHTSIKTRQQYTLCLSRYIVAHTLKWQTDISYTKTEGSSDLALMYRFQLEIGI